MDIQGGICPLILLNSTSLRTSAFSAVKYLSDLA